MSKERTWPYAMVEHPGTNPASGQFNIRLIDGVVLFAEPQRNRALVQHITHALNEAFDHGREIYQQSHGGRQ